MADDMMSLDEVRRFFGGEASPLGRTTIYDWVKTGKLAKPIKIGQMTSRWRRSDCEIALKRLMEPSE